MQKAKKVNILAIGAHPDDIEACGAGLLLKATNKGLITATVDLTRGEMGTNGTPAVRARESKQANKILGTRYHENLGVPDANIVVNRTNMLKVLRLIRKYQPDTVLAPWTHDRHPDHENVGKLVAKACFYSGLTKIKTGQEKWRPKNVFYFMMHYDFDPDFVLDISDVHEKKLEALRCHKSQFTKAKNSVGSYINNPEFLKFWENRARYYGYKTGVEFGEPYKIRGGKLGLKDITDITTNSV